MKATVSEPESWKRVIEIEVPEQEVQAAFDEKISTYKKELKLPGFRPGHVPTAVIKQRFGGSIRAEVIDNLVQKTFQNACEDNKILPISQAKVNDLKAQEGESLKFTIEIEIDPSIEITGYNKLKVKASPKKIKDSDIDDAVKNLQERLAEYKDIDRASKKGDYVRIEYVKVVIDGEVKTDVESPTYPVEIGGENRIKDFDKGLIGKIAGEIADISVNFPKDYSDTNVAGKEGEFQVKIVAVQEKILPEINEEFLKKVGDFADESALRKDIREHLEKEENDKAKNDAYAKAIEQLINENPFDVPPARVESFLDYMHEEALKYQRGTEPIAPREEMKDKYQETAVRSLKRQRIIDFIAQKENIKPTQEDVDKEIERIAKMYNQPFETVKQAFRKNGTTNRIRADLREQKTLDFLIGELQLSSEPAEKSEE